MSRETGEPRRAGDGRSAPDAAPQAEAPQAEAPQAETRPDRVCVGALAGAYGVRGEARVKPFTADPEAIASYGALETEDGERRFELRLTRALKGAYAARLSGVATREQAEALKGVRLYAPRAALPETEEDEFYHADLIGLSVVALSGEALGRVIAVQDYGAGDMLEVAVGPRRESVLLPFTRETTPHVDMERGEIIADPPDGLFEDARAPSATAKDAARR